MCGYRGQVNVAVQLGCGLSGRRSFEMLQFGRYAVVLVVGCTVMQAGCSSPPPAKEPVSPREEPPAVTRPADELEQVRAECRVLSEACVQRAVGILNSHPDAAVRIFSDACSSDIARGCVELGHAYSGDGVLPQDGKRADDAYARACRLDPGWCD
jgi:hypothetical protein